MSVQITTLPNGLRVVSDHMPHLATTSFGVWVASGARHECEAENGISHLLEHMAFKGTPDRSPQAIAEEIEALGGDLNAATSHETTAYFARVLAGDEAAALTILADILQNSLFLESELKREQDVILQEIAAAQDSPEDIVFDLLHEVAYPGQALGRPILGTPDRVQRFSPDDLRAHLKQHYQAGKMTISAAGGVDHAALVRHAEALFQAPNRAVTDQMEPARYVGGVAASSRPFEQCHVAIGFEGPSYRDPAYFAAQVFSGIFGGGMSSRLFQEVREKRGLCYAIYSSVWGLGDTGMTYLHAATAPEAARELTDVIAGELSKMCQEPPAQSEMQRAKAQLKVGLLSALESSGARTEQMARHLIAYGKLIAKEELIQRVDAVTAQDVLNCARDTAASRATVSIVGAGEESQELADHGAGEFEKLQGQDRLDGISTNG